MGMQRDYLEKTLIEDVCIKCVCFVRATAPYAQNFISSPGQAGLSLENPHFDSIHTLFGLILC